MIPWQPGCPHRQAALDWVAARYDELGWPVHLGRLDGPWCKAAAVQRAIDTTDADVLVVADADVWSDDITRAVDQVTGRYRWAVPHSDVIRLNQSATGAVLAGSQLLEVCGYDEKPYRGRPGGGLVVVTRELWETCPMDPRFIGWGQEDEAWGHALIGTAGQPPRGNGPLWHLWHPPQPRRDRSIGSAESLDLCRRYLIAARHPDQLSRLLAEARAALEEVPV